MTRSSAERELLVVEGRLISVAPLTPGDTSTIHAVFDQLSDESRWRRYLSQSPRLAPAAARVLADADGYQHHVVVAHELNGERGGGQPPRPIALARLVRTGAHSAEPALEVVDRWQHRGFGTLLAERLLRDARALGIDVLEGTASAENRAVLRLLRAYLGPSSLRFDSGVVEFSAPLPLGVRALRPSHATSA